MNFSLQPNTLASSVLEWNSTALSLWLQTAQSTYALLDQIADPTRINLYGGYWALYAYSDNLPLAARAIYNITELEYDCNITNAWAKKSAGTSLTFVTPPPPAITSSPPSTTPPSVYCPFSGSCELVNETVTIINSSVSEQNRTVVLPASSQTNVTGDLALRDVNITVTASNSSTSLISISGCANFSGVLVLQVQAATYAAVLTVPLLTTNCVNSYFDRVIRPS